jgi:cathepsin X
MINEKDNLPLLNPSSIGKFPQMNHPYLPSRSSRFNHDEQPSYISFVKISVLHDRYRVRTIASVLAWIALGCAIGSLFHSTSTQIPLDFTHGAFQHHAVTSELDALATSCRQEKNDSGKSVSKKKNTHWFLGGPDPELRITFLPSMKSIEELPEHWDWRDYNGTGISLLTSVMNQMAPRPCGSCWAFATVSALSDRIRIAKYLKTKKLSTEVVLSPQVLLDCGMRSFGSCSGGDPRYAHKWIHEHGIVDITCNPYIASHPSWFAIGESCAATQCRHCMLDGECKPMKNPKKYYISEYGTLNATTPEEFEIEAMNEIYHRGPIVVSMYSHSKEYINYKGGYVLRDSTKYPGTTHVVSIVGWGIENEVKYWIVRNSDGTNWGEDGFFLAERGTNIYNMEGHGAWAVPIIE